MGFRGDEFAAAVVASGEVKQMSIKSFNQNLMYAAPTDYSELDDYIAHNVAKNHLLKSEVTPISSKVTREDIYSRRSARFFEDKALSEEDTEHFMQLASSANHSVSCYNILLRDSSKRAGIYLKGKLVKEGYFAELLTKILVEQSFIKNAQIITVVTAEYFSANKLIQAGALVHNLYLEAESKKLGCSGIGAFYDEKLQNFLSTDAYILYVSAVGVQKK